MMTKKPEERYQTGRDLLRDLTRVRDGISGGGSAPQLFSDLGETPKTVVEMPLPAGREELPRRHRILERDPGHRAKAGTATLPGQVSPADLHIPGSHPAPPGIP